MQKQTADSVKLGLFVLAGLVLLILTLYYLGKNRSLFGSDLELKTHFRTVNGLVPGNNVRFSGIEVGGVQDVVFINDTTIEVTMNIDKKMKEIIRTNAMASLGTDGLIGNRVVNIVPGKGVAPFVEEGDVLLSKEEINTDEMLQTLRRTNNNVAVITEELIVTLHRINTSSQLTQLLEDKSLSANLKASLVHLHETTEKASALMTSAGETLALASKGEGTLATLLTDTTLALEIQQAVRKIQTVEASAERLANDLDAIAASVDTDLNQGPGTINALMKDSLMAERLRQTMDNVEKGTAAFNVNMEAMRHNWLFKGYFKEQEKEKKKAEKEAAKQKKN
ncbi:MAG TPA: MlaD family protein [Saprospiraceae bacterium]|nr:MlaD family protein [Saprospiraceae bacterium]